MKKAILLPLKFSLLIMFGSIFIYIFGPISWIKNSDIIAYITVGLVLVYFVAFGLGYLLRIGHKENIIINENKISCNKTTIMKMLKYTIYINFVLTVLLALIYTNATSVSELFNKMINGLMSPSDAYYTKDATSRSGSIVVWISLIYSPWMYITKVCGLCLFKELSLRQKSVYVLSILAEIMRWLAIGTNKGLFDIVILFLFSYLYLQIKLFCNNNYFEIRKMKKTVHKIFIVSFVLILGFFSFFSMAISSRVGGNYNQTYFQKFPYKLIPINLRFLVEKVDDYLTQGYAYLTEIIRHCNFKWTFGVGNSRFLMSIVDSILGIDLTSRTYPYQLEAYGIDPLACWHTAYAWFASDFTFIGVIIFMFLVGYYMCGLVKDVIKDDDFVAITLLYMVILSVVNASCTNYILAYSGSFIPFVALFLYRLCKKKKVGIIRKKKIIIVRGKAK